VAALEACDLSEVAFVADDSASRTALWALREAIPEAAGALGIAHKVDVGIPAPQLAEFITTLPATVSGVFPDARLFVFGHLADGNVHVAIVGPPADDSSADGAVLDRVIALGGTISAEHGVGVAKVDWLERARGHEQFDAICQIKRALDPAGTLNPGVIIKQ
jgi:FAD/FMN-containing dehydrogenase